MTLILQCRAPQENIPKSHWGSNCFLLLFDQILVLVVVVVTSWLLIGLIFGSQSHGLAIVLAFLQGLPPLQPPRSQNQKLHEQLFLELMAYRRHTGYYATSNTTRMLRTPGVRLTSLVIMAWAMPLMAVYTHPFRVQCVVCGV